MSPPEAGDADLLAILRAIRAATGSITETGAYTELVEAVGDEVARVVPYHSLRLFFCDPIAEELYPVAVRSTLTDRATTDLDSPRMRMPLGRGLTGRIAEDRTPLLVHDVSSHPDVYYAPGTEAIEESFIGVPLVFRDDLVGVLTVTQHGLGQYDEEQLLLVEILGVAIAAAVGHRRAVEAEARARREEERLRQLHTAFISNISHELRTPLTTALGFLDLARERADAPEELPELVERSRRGVDRLRILIERLLEVVSIEAGRQRLNLDAHGLTGILDDARAKALIEPARLRLTGDLEAKIVVDGPRFTHLVAEVLDNASRHGPKDGAIEVEVAAGEACVEILVHDEGPGIEPDVSEAIFERFVQGSAQTRAQGGTGLGLSLARSIARWHDGDLTIRPGPKTTFVITVPMRDEWIRGG